MSDPVKCDNCNAAGRRKRGAIAPAGWFYASMTLDESEDVIYIYACCKACTQLTWHAGPGALGGGTPGPSLTSSLEAKAETPDQAFDRISALARAELDQPAQDFDALTLTVRAEDGSRVDYRTWYEGRLK